MSLFQADTEHTRPTRETRVYFQNANKMSIANLPKLSMHAQEYKKYLKDQGLHEPTVKMIIFGDFEICTWYSAPFPEEYCVDVLFICEGCLKYMKSEFMFLRHREKCFTPYPPGDEIYRDEKLSIFEIDGRKNKVYTIIHT